MLRPRYRPGWIPSWKDTGKHWAHFEDGIALSHPAIIDATRLRRRDCYSKAVLSKRDPHEKEITMFLASEPAKSGMTSTIPDSKQLGKCLNVSVRYSRACSFFMIVA
ncbi:hypothetical protein QCA50_003886 [Cerrena zonata]|uniref:Uncharacterized protein n=1 Tax=Cerrena zonata TaxID=2478898 RepID=A0AAW0GHN9_9APHY